MTQTKHVRADRANQVIRDLAARGCQVITVTPAGTITELPDFVHTLKAREVPAVLIVYQETP